MEKVIEVLREATKIIGEDIIKGAYVITVHPGACYLNEKRTAYVVTIQADITSDRVGWLNEKAEIKISESGIISGTLKSDKVTVRVVLA